MKNLSRLDEIAVPRPPNDELYTAHKFGRQFSFAGLKGLLGAADYSKAGDRNAGLAARDEAEREVARSILSTFTLQQLYDHPLTDDSGSVDSVMRVNYDIRSELYTAHKFGRQFSFAGLKGLLGAADYSKAGDRNAGLAARDEAEREVARSILSTFTLQQLYDHPLTDDSGSVDSVMRVNYDI